MKSKLRNAIEFENIQKSNGPYIISGSRLMPVVYLWRDQLVAESYQVVWRGPAEYRHAVTQSPTVDFQPELQITPPTNPTKISPILPPQYIRSLYLGP